MFNISTFAEQTVERFETMPSFVNWYRLGKDSGRGKLGRIRAWQSVRVELETQGFEETYIQQVIQDIKDLLKLRLMAD